MLANGYPLNVIHNIWHIEYYIIILLHHELFLSLSSVSIDILIEQGGGSVLREILCCSNMTHVQYICVPLSNCQFTRQLNLGAELYSLWQGSSKSGSSRWHCEVYQETKREREKREDKLFEASFKQSSQFNKIPTLYRKFANELPIKVISTEIIIT